MKNLFKTIGNVFKTIGIVFLGFIRYIAMVTTMSVGSLVVIVIQIVGTMIIAPINAIRLLATGEYGVDESISESYDELYFKPMKTFCEKMLSENEEES